MSRDELEERLGEYPDLESALKALIPLGLSSTRIVDSWMITRDGVKAQRWAQRRGVCPEAIYNSLSETERVLAEQSQLQDYEEGEQPREPTGGQLAQGLHTASN